MMVEANFKKDDLKDLKEKGFGPSMARKTPNYNQQPAKCASLKAGQRTLAIPLVRQESLASLV